MVDIITHCTDFVAVKVGDTINAWINGILFEKTQILDIQDSNIVIKTEKGAIKAVNQKDLNLSLKEGPITEKSAIEQKSTLCAIFHIDRADLKLRQNQEKIYAFSRNRPTTSLSVTTSGASIVNVTTYDDGSLTVSASPLNQPSPSFPPILISNSDPTKWEQVAALTASGTNFGREVIFY